MSQSNKRFRINTLIQLARITENETLREELVNEIQELLDDIETSQVTYHEVSDFQEDLIEPIAEYLKDKYRVCAVEIWQKALGKKGRPQKWQSTEINDIISQIPGWEKMKNPYKFGKYGNQRGYQKEVKQEINNGLE